MTEAQTNALKKDIAFALKQISDGSYQDRHVLSSIIKPSPLNSYQY